MAEPRTMREPATLGTIVEDAHQSVRRVVDAPVPAVVPRVLDAARSVSAALESIQDIITYSLDEVEPRIVLSEAYSHEAPQLILASAEDARSHSRGMADAHAAILAERGPAPTARSRALAVRSVDADLAEANAQLSREISETWITESYLGSSLGGRFERTPPILTTEPPEFFDLTDDAFSYRDSRGLYFRGTSHVVISSEEHDESDRRVLIAHEQLHYAAWLGGGRSIRWSREEGRETVLGYVSWLHEGLTELHAQQLTREHGHVPTRIGYLLETAVSSYLQRLVGPRRLREAYLSGDFSEVRRMVNGRLGGETFDRLARMENGYEALVFLRSRLDAAGIDYNAWHDPLSDVRLVSVESEGRTGN
ncbi:MAG: hypothetical protein ABH983_02895 [Candidatus Micrarchaeota archaeon]